MRNKIGPDAAERRIMRGAGVHRSCSGAEEEADLGLFLFVARAEDEQRESVRVHNVEARRTEKKTERERDI